MPVPTPTLIPEPTPVPPTPSPEPEPTPIEQPTVIPQPEPSPEPSPEPELEEPEPLPTPQLLEETPTPEEVLLEEIDEPPVQEVWQPSPTITSTEEEEESAYEDYISFEDIDWEEYDFNDLPEIVFEEDPFVLEDFEQFEEGQEELLMEEEIFDEEIVDEYIPEETQTETEEETTFVDEGEQEEHFELTPDVGLKEQDFETLEIEDLDGETLVEILQIENAAEEFLEEVIEDNPDFFEESSEEELEQVFIAAPEIFNAAPNEVKEEFEEEINIFAGGFEDYQAEDSTITVAERRVVVTATAISAVAAARPMVRPSSAPTAGGPSVPQKGRRNRR